MSTLPPCVPRSSSATASSPTTTLWRTQCSQTAPCGCGRWSWISPGMRRPRRSRYSGWTDRFSLRRSCKKTRIGQSTSRLACGIRCTLTSMPMLCPTLSAGRRESPVTPTSRRCPPSSELAQWCLWRRWSSTPMSCRADRWRCKSTVVQTAHSSSWRMTARALPTRRGGSASQSWSGMMLSVHCVGASMGHRVGPGLSVSSS
mmetsp:Transcript_41401/g.88227  ORF Transcript_41401/g.88227 Transcript_41401/m.88227 type:complete len:202 (-) Transcript_41401:245-850(-)